jgi:hypothetical protein
LGFVVGVGMVVCGAVVGVVCGAVVGVGVVVCTVVVPVTPVGDVTTVVPVLVGVDEDDGVVELDDSPDPDELPLELPDELPDDEPFDGRYRPMPGTYSLLAAVIV